MYNMSNKHFFTETPQESNVLQLYGLLSCLCRNSCALAMEFTVKWVLAHMSESVLKNSLNNMSALYLLS